ncbi:hypothetical protein M422DRAFT_85577, partial [Sphaerobolus stellatus SS14]
ALSLLAVQTAAFPQYQSLGGLSQRELVHILPRFTPVTPPAPPGPPSDTSVKLVNDEAHPYIPPRNGDMRGPCPGLNTLASHGYLPRNGIVTPAQIINAVQDGFGMDNSLAIQLVYATMLVDGNPLTNLMSIGAKSSLTGPDPPKPAIVGGVDTHAVLEGMLHVLSIGDFFFGDNHSFNQTLFNELVAFSNQFGGGNYNLTVATEYRFHRIQQSIAENPTFTFISPRIVTAYGEATFPFVFFVDGRKADGQLSMKDALGFFRDGRMPDDFHRADASKTSDLVDNGVDAIFTAHPVQPDFVNVTVRSLYPNPQGALRNNLNKNLDFFFLSVAGQCAQIFPYGQ